MPTPITALHRRQFLRQSTGALALALPTATSFAQAAAPTASSPWLVAANTRAQQARMVLVAGRVEPDGPPQFHVATPEPAAMPGLPRIDADSRFEYGSITKTFVALLLADQVLNAGLSLDDAVEPALPGGLRLRDAARAPLRWVDLATHRSGLPRLPDNLAPASMADPYASYDEERLKAFLRSWQPTTARDQAWAYSNLGFGLLGQALAWRAGRPFDQLLRERVLAPLDLGEVQVAHRPVPGLLPGHDAEGRRASAWHFDALAGAGALVGSARSLARYAQAALGLIKTPLEPAFQLALQPQAPGQAAGTRSGLAWLVVQAGGRTLCTHDGGTGGFSSSLWLDPAARRATLVLANAQQPVGDLALNGLLPEAPVRNLAAERRAAEEAMQQPAQTLPAAALAALAGRYRLNPQLALDLRVREGRLFAQATGQPEFELFASAPRRFFARVTALEIRFEGEDGEAPGLELRQLGQVLRFVREAGPAVAPRSP